MPRFLLAATAIVALLLWTRRLWRGEPRGFNPDALDFLRTVVQPFGRDGHPDDRFL